MSTTLPPLIIPVESQVREFDAKLLLSCVAAEKGFPVIFGHQTRVHLKITSLPRGIYFAKDICPSKVRILSILKLLGHDIVAWDEEGLVRNPREEYLKDRVSARALDKISLYFSWGHDDAEVIRSHPNGNRFPVYETGNPRLDFLQKELRTIFADDAQALQKKYGPFILINTNFGTSNHFLARRTLHTMDPDERSGGEQEDWHHAMIRYRNNLFAHFVDMVPKFAAAFPDTTIILRPHPSESLENWREVTKECPNVKPIIEGNVVSWIMASQVLVHNGCTTAIESFFLDKPAVTYQPVKSDEFDRHLPDSISTSTTNLDELIDCVRSFVEGRHDHVHTDEQRRYLDRHIVQRDGELVCDRIIDIIRNSDIVRNPHPPPSLMMHVFGWLKAKIRMIQKRINAYIPGSKNSFKYERRRFPGISENEVRAQIAQLQQQLGRFDNITVRTLSKSVFQIEATDRPEMTPRV